jgi:hypothetical protein
MVADAAVDGLRILPTQREVADVVKILAWQDVEAEAAAAQDP